MRILELAGSTGLYGAERWILALLRHLDRARISPALCAIQDQGDSDAPVCLAAQQLGVPSYVIKARSRIDVSLIRSIRDTIAQSGASILHTHGYRGDLLGRLATLGTNCKIVSTPHGWTHSPDLKLRAYEALDRAVLRFLDAVVPLSEQMYADLAAKSRMRERLLLINNAVDLDELDCLAGLPEELTGWKSRQLFIIGYVGRLIRDKGIQTILRAMSHLPRRTVAFVAVGEGPDKRDFVELSDSLGLSENVAFLGYRDDRLAFVRHMDLFVLPSQSEGLPRCAMEAMGLGVPVAASDIPGCRALITDGATGRLFPTGDDAALARVIKELQQNPAERMRLAEKGKQHVRDRFSAKRMAREYEDLFLRLQTPARAGCQPEVQLRQGR